MSSLLLYLLLNQNFHHAKVARHSSCITSEKAIDALLFTSFSFTKSAERENDAPLYEVIRLLSANFGNRSLL